MNGKPTLAGRIFKTANGHDTYEIYNAKAEIMFPIFDILVAEFGCTSPDLPVFSLDTVVSRCSKDGHELLIGWDIWSGFYITATSDEGNKWVVQIGALLNRVITSESYDEYIDDF